MHIKNWWSKIKTGAVQEVTREQPHFGSQLQKNIIAKSTRDTAVKVYTILIFYARYPQLCTDGDGGLAIALHRTDSHTSVFAIYNDIIIINDLLHYYMCNSVELRWIV